MIIIIVVERASSCNGAGANEGRDGKEERVLALAPHLKKQPNRNYSHLFIILLDIDVALALALSLVLSFQRQRQQQQPSVAGTWCKTNKRERERERIISVVGEKLLIC
jgi:hypothetical protein